MTPKEKIARLAQIMNVSINSIILDPNSFEIEEIYVDETQTHHYKVVLGGKIVLEKTKKK